MKDPMTRTLIAGFVAGALLGAYGNAFGPWAVLLVLGCGLAGMVLAGGGTIALRIDRSRLMELLGELER